jgi:HSP20 family protein
MPAPEPIFDPRRWTMNITRYEPFADVFRGTDNLFDDLFRGFFVRPVPTAEAPARPRVDVNEEANAYQVRADLPGVKKEDIDVTVEGDVLSISAETKSENEKKEGERVVMRERSYGKWSRAFRLGAEIDLARAAAKYENGVLELTLPKKAGEPVKKLTVQ